MRVSDYETDENTLSPDSTLEEIAQQYIKGKSMTKIQDETGMMAAKIYGMFATLVDEPIFKDIVKVLVKSTKKATFRNTKALLKEYTTINTRMVDCLKKHDVNRKTYCMWIAIYREKLGPLYDDFLKVKKQKKIDGGKASVLVRKRRKVKTQKLMFEDFPKRISKAEFKKRLFQNNYNTLSISNYIELAKKEGIEVF
ncbi:hypothetical protein [Clostridium cellulovorans]|uniref:Uncharacterized protein n=1 Tax=Clostridium cellulovorans (strain ATCC 35296 / DSM 3052 / OCM 3 / 743B) TaxID=573061 RepID=D9SWG4_CLOC7|nr:hypothetical protein [Clostridium cellulovorans]ADL53246.1 hypothetical protein Clocel_3571 [Clostridium cellulovorans 743B]